MLSDLDKIKVRDAKIREAEIALWQITIWQIGDALARARLQCNINRWRRELDALIGNDLRRQELMQRTKRGAK